MKKVFIIHGWEHNPNQHWYPWLKHELESKGFQVEVPAMPNTEEPKIEEWVPFLEEKVGTPDENTFFVGHSIGCQTILRFLQDLPHDVKIGGVIFVAGWFHLIGIEDEEGAEDIAKPWIETPIHFENIIDKTNKFTAIFSDNDPYVPIGDAKLFEEKLGARIIFESRKGHFTEDDNVKDLKVVLNEILEMAK